MTSLSDGDLLVRHRAGDGRALACLFERYRTPVYQYLLGVLRDHHQAEDALQETFVRALERLGGVDPAHLRGWLFTVAYHQAMLAKRRQKSSTRVAAGFRRMVDEEAGPLRAAELQDEVGRIRSLLERLPPQQREVILQRVYEGKRFRDIARTLHCPLNTALARMHEGLKKLRRLCAQRESDRLSGSRRRATIQQRQPISAAH